MMLRKKTCPERDVRKMLDNHLDMVGAVMYKGLDTIEHYLNDNIENFCDFCLSQRPQIPKDFRKAFLHITRSNIEMFSDLKGAVETLH
jgi:hypothetical protein